jgi:hypothetical protein
MGRSVARLILVYSVREFSSAKTENRECAMKTLTTSAIAIIASLGLVGNAMAANMRAAPRATPALAPYAQPYVDVAAIPPYPNYQSSATPQTARARTGFDVAARAPYAYPAAQYPVAQYPVAFGPANVGQLIGMLFGGALPIPSGSHYTGNAGYDQGSYDPTFDTPTQPTVVDNTASDEAIAASDAAIQENDANLAALDASIAAAEAQNDADTAATQQYLINNGM